MGCLTNSDLDGGLIRGREIEMERETPSIDKALLISRCLIPLVAPLSITWLYIIDFHISLSQSSWFWNYLPFNRSSIWHECAALVPCLCTPPPLHSPRCLFVLRWQGLWPVRGDGLSIRQLQTGFCCPLPKKFAELNSNNANTSTHREYLPPPLHALAIPLPLCAQKQRQLHKTAARPINSD